MGEDNLIRNDLVFSVNDGNARRPIGKLASGAEPAEGCLFIEGDDQKEYIEPHKQGSFLFKLDFPSCPSRKRFVKMLMAGGLSRNDANKAAKMVVDKRTSYKLLLFFLRIAGFVE